MQQFPPAILAGMVASLARGTLFHPPVRTRVVRAAFAGIGGAAIDGKARSCEDFLYCPLFFCGFLDSRPLQPLSSTSCKETLSRVSLPLSASFLASCEIKRVSFPVKTNSAIVAFDTLALDSTSNDDCVVESSVRPDVLRIQTDSIIAVSADRAFPTKYTDSA